MLVAGRLIVLQVYAYTMSIKVKLPMIKQKWCLEALDEQYKKSLLRDRQRKNSNANNR